MFRGRKRKLPSFFVPEPFYYGSDSDDGRRPHGHRVRLPPEDQRRGYEAHLQQVLLDQVHEVPLRQFNEEPVQGNVPDVRRGQDVIEDHEQEEPILIVVPHSDDDNGIHSESEVEQEEELAEVVPDVDVDMDEHIAVDVDNINVMDSDDDYNWNVNNILPFPVDVGVEQHEAPPPDGEDNESLSDESFIEEPEGQNYEDLLQELKEKWIDTELDHNVSNSASNAFWRVATAFFPKLVECRHLENVKKKIPQFNHIRKKLYDENVPEIDMQIGYRSKTTNETTVVDCTKAPQKRFPPDKFEKIFEIASVKVKT